jgi:hypothetical protein
MPLKMPSIPVESNVVNSAGISCFAAFSTMDGPYLSDHISIWLPVGL